MRKQNRRKKPVHSSLLRQIAQYELLKLEHIVDLQISTQQMIQSKTTYLASIKTYTHKSRLLFFFVPLIPNPPSLQDAFHPCHSARSRRRSRRIHIQKIILAFRERRDRRRRWVGWGRVLSSTPHPPWWGTLPREKVIFRVLKCGFCNFGQALRAE